MLELNESLPAEQRVVLAVDTSDIQRARELAGLAYGAGAKIIKEGLELASAPGSDWEFCSRNAAAAGLDWVADAKIDDIPNTTAAFVRNLSRLEHPPVAITIHAHSGVDSMEAAQEVVGRSGIVMLGVTELTTVTERELRETYGFVLAAMGVQTVLEEDYNLRNLLVHTRALNAVRAGIGGLVASAKELRDPIKSSRVTADKLTMIPGTRSIGAETHDQQNVDTPFQAIVNGADLLVIGRQVTNSADPEEAFSKVVEEIQQGLIVKAAAPKII